MDMEPLDKEWIALILKAKRMGMTIDEIRLYLQHNRQHVTYSKERLVKGEKAD
ncbi:MerR, DNA binding [Lentibacillus halodurans]|uniref:MerR, DNA binding n=1 Tax=Lentibacillus halodurans TaxID=237679 RepID=A0A1I0YR07_9BACI|nr:anti-repressor SinI family protein [Lentibacillus halodurans]SFB15642.1 MerR, DNA binding [Lentibacillus halodurans]